LFDAAQSRAKPSPAAAESLLLAAVALAPAAFSLDLVSFLHAKESLILGLLALAAGWCLLRRGAPSLAEHARWWWPVWMLLGYGLLCGGFSPDGLATAAMWAGILLWAWLAAPALAAPAARYRLLWAILAGAGITALAAVLEAAGWMRVLGLPPREPLTSLFGNRDLLGGYLALALAASLGLRGTCRRANHVLLPVLFVLSFALVISGSRSAWLAAAAGLAITAFWRTPQIGRRAWALYAMIAAGAITALLTQPQPAVERIGATFSYTDTGGWVRVWLWDASLRMLADHGSLGLGLGRFPAESSAYMADALHGTGGTRYPANGLPGEHAHNDALELLCETGLPGGVLACVFLWILWRRRTAETAAPLAALAVFSGFNAALFSAPHALAGVLLAQAAFSARASDPPVPARGSAAMLALAALALWPAHLGYVLLPSSQLAAAESAHLRGDSAEEAYERAARWPYTRPAALGFAAMHAYDHGNDALAAERAGQSVAMKGWPQVLAVRALALARLQDPAATGALDEALRQWPVNQQVFDAAWNLADETRRVELTEHAARWGLTPP